MLCCEASPSHPQKQPAHWHTLYWSHILLSHSAFSPHLSNTVLTSKRFPQGLLLWNPKVRKALPSQCPDVREPTMATVAYESTNGYNWISVFLGVRVPFFLSASLEGRLVQSGHLGGRTPLKGWMEFPGSHGFCRSGGSLENFGRWGGKFICMPRFLVVTVAVDLGATGGRGLLQSSWSLEVWGADAPKDPSRNPSAALQSVQRKPFMPAGGMGRGRAGQRRKNNSQGVNGVGLNASSDHYSFCQSITVMCLLCADCSDAQII